MGDGRVVEAGRNDGHDWNFAGRGRKERRKMTEGKKKKGGKKRKLRK